MEYQFDSRLQRNRIVVAPIKVHSFFDDVVSLPPRTSRYVELPQETKLTAQPVPMVTPWQLFLTGGHLPAQPDREDAESSDEDMKEEEAAESSDEDMGFGLFD